MPLTSNPATCPPAPSLSPCLILCTLTCHFCVSLCCVHVFGCMFFVWYVVFCSCVCMFLVACFWLHISGCMSFVCYVVFWCCVCMSLVASLSLQVFRFICRIFRVLCVVWERTAAADERAASCSPRCLRQALCRFFPVSICFHHRVQAVRGQPKMCQAKVSMEFICYRACISCSILTAATLPCASVTSFRCLSCVC